MLHLCLLGKIVIRSYHGGNTRSHPNSEVKHYWAYLVLRWGTTREPYVLNDFFFLILPPKWCKNITKKILMR